MYIYDIISNISSFNEKYFRELLQRKSNHTFMFKNFLRKLCRLSENVEKYGRARQVTDDNIIRRMHFACWITRDTDTHSEYAMLIFFWQKWLQERASLLFYTYIAFLVKYWH